jgi:hypothetical protein
MVLNVSDHGMAISMAIPVGDEAYSNLHVRMNGLPQSIEVHGRMSWTTKSKKRAGIQLVDVSDEQRGQIREWLAQEGVRDVNLRPRVSEPAASVLPAFAGAATSPRLLDEPRSNLSPVAAAGINPAISPDPHASLLAGLGGTAPESLGPAQDESSLTEDTLAETKSSQSYQPNFVGFRENEWDLASITMVPRKRSKPEGLSALSLLLLWIAIPSFGIGLIVGRRPLQQWLSQGGAMRKNISHVATPESKIASARDESRDITGSDIDASGPQSVSTRSIATREAMSAQDAKTSAATKSFVSTPAVLDSKLLNSMSTQELRAFKPRSSTAPPENPDAGEGSKMGSKAEPNTFTKDGFSSPAAPVKADPQPNVSTASRNSTTTDVANASARRADSKDKSAVKPTVTHDSQSNAINKEAPRGQGFSKHSPTDQVARTMSFDSGVNAGATNHSGVPPLNVAAPHSSAVNVATTSVSRPASSSTASISAAPGTEISTTRQITAGATPNSQAVGNASTTSTPLVNHSVTPVSGTAGNSIASSSVSDASHNNNVALTVPKTRPASPSSSTTTLSGRAVPSPASLAPSDATPPIAPSVRPDAALIATSSAATKVAPSAYGSSSSRSAAPSGATNLAPVNAQAPLHGVMLVGRKNNEAFLLRLPLESVASGHSVSVQMQRFVMVPPESRWHHHGPIAKLAVGELLTQVAAKQLETASNARPGDAVTVRAFVDKNGSVQDLKPVSGRFALMPRMMREVREWQFDQTLIDGKPVESEVNITVEFRSGPQPPIRNREIEAQNSFKP